MLQQDAGSFVVAYEPAAIDIAVADTVLKWDSPLPTGRAGARHGKWSQLPRALARNCDSAVAGQPMRPVFVTCLQCLLDEQTAKTGGIDIEISLDALAALERQRLDKTVLAPKLNMHYLPFRPPDSACFRVGTQIARVQTRVKMICIL